MNVRIKFRFAGDEFPPYIVFKIYTHICDGHVAKYIDGRNMIKPNSIAAKEACNQMGNRKYFNIMITDTLQQQDKTNITHPDHVVSLKEHMQYSSLIDDMPAYLGGRSNAWRRLNLQDLPRHTIFYDVISYAITKKMSTNLRKELPILLRPPKDQGVQLKQIKILSRMSYSMPQSMDADYTTVNPSMLNSSNFKSTISQTSSRRSKNAIIKVTKMKKAYSMTRSETLTTIGGHGQGDVVISGRVSESFKMTDELEDNFEDEVKDLYMWTKNLSVNEDIFSNTPRLSNY